MSISLKIEKKFSSLGFEKIEATKKKFYAEVAKQLPYVIASTIQKGISPVEGIGRFKQYSKSYVDQIEGRVQFRYINGRAVPFYPKENQTKAASGKKGAFSPLGYNKKYDTLITNKNGNFGIVKNFPKGLGEGKLKSPVNMTVTGVMVGSIQGTVVSNGALIKFDSPIAKYHNGEGRVDRHILPKGSETFSSLIMKKLRDLLREAFIN